MPDITIKYSTVNHPEAKFGVFYNGKRRDVKVNGYNPVLDENVSKIKSKVFTNRVVAENYDFIDWRGDSPS